MYDREGLLLRLRLSCVHSFYLIQHITIYDIEVCTKFTFFLLPLCLPLQGPYLHEIMLGSIDLSKLGL